MDWSKDTLDKPVCLLKIRKTCPSLPFTLKSKTSASLTFSCELLQREQRQLKGQQNHKTQRVKKERKEFVFFATPIRKTKVKENVSFYLQMKFWII